jgi:hypothetical protein
MSVYKRVDLKYLTSSKCGLKMLGDSWTDRMKNRISITKNQGRKEHPTCKKRKKANRIGNMLRWNCPLKHVIKEKVAGEKEGTSSRGRRRKHFLEDLNQ